jgi:hypothetical protein
MTNVAKYGLLIGLCFLAQFATPQHEQKNEAIQQRIEFLAENLEVEDVVLSQITEDLFFFIEHPINLNKTTGEDLKLLGLLSDVQILALIHHRKKFGKLISIYEIQAIPYWDLHTIELILPFVHVDDKFDQLHVSVKEMLKYGNGELLMRYQRILEDKKGYSPPSSTSSPTSFYHGNPDRYYTRLRFTYRTNLSVGITAEKDPGEEFFRGSNKNGFDFYSAHAFYQGGKYLKTVALGDYQLQIGQGVGFWSGHAFNKTADVVSIKKNARGLRPYASVDETRFLRGAATEVGYSNFSLITFGSIKGVDASVQTTLDSLNQEEAFVSSINMTGLHRTQSEIERKNALEERIFGSYLTYKTTAFSVGVSAIHQSYDKAYIRPELSYNQYHFRGKELFSVSGDYSYVFKNTQIFGEAVRSGSGAIGFVQGAMIAVDSRMSLSLLYRHYPRDFHTFYAQGFRESSTTQNEKGLFTGLNWRFANKWTLNTYLDFFAFPWLRYQVYAPSSGNEFLTQISFKPNRQLEIYGRYRTQNRPRNSRNTDGSIKGLENIQQQNYRLHFAYKVSESITLKARIEYVTVERKSSMPESGVLLYQDLVYKPMSFPVDISLRYAIFDTDSYDSRIYAFENNMLNVFYIPAHTYKGSRTYLLLRWTFAKRFDLWVKYGVFLYDNQKTIGSSTEMINGNQKTDFGVQLRMKF